MPFILSGTPAFCFFYCPVTSVHPKAAPFPQAFLESSVLSHNPTALTAPCAFSIAAASHLIKHGAYLYPILDTVVGLSFSYIPRTELGSQ
jgi:hypothetical protein